MEGAVIRTQVQFEEEQYQGLKELANQQQILISAVLRKAVDQFPVVRKPRRDSLYRDALRVAGKHEAGKHEVAINHDQ